MSDQKISSLLAFSLISSPLISSTMPSLQYPEAAVSYISSNRSSVRRMKEQLPALLNGAPQGKTAQVASISDDGHGGRLYELDNGILLSFRAYNDPMFDIGEEISWVKQGNGILIKYETGSFWLRGDFEMNSFTTP